MAVLTALGDSSPWSDPTCVARGGLLTAASTAHLQSRTWVQAQHPERTFSRRHGHLVPPVLAVIGAVQSPLPCSMQRLHPLEREAASRPRSQKQRCWGWSSGEVGAPGQASLAWTLPCGCVVPALLCGPSGKDPMFPRPEDQGSIVSRWTPGALSAPQNLGGAICALEPPCITEKQPRTWGD